MTTDINDAAERPNVEYVIFDLDGLLIDSERLYTEVTNEILAKYGKTMTWEIKAGLMGKPERESTAHLLAFFPDLPLSLDAFLAQRNAGLAERWPHTQPLPGAARLLAHLESHGVPTALATGARRASAHLKTAHLGPAFGALVRRAVFGDDARVAPGRGKPCPDVYLVAAREELGRGVGADEAPAGALEQRERARGLVFEDAVPGVVAAKRAGMQVVWVPDAALLDLPYSEELRPDEILHSLEDFVPEKYGLPPYDS